MCGSAAPSVVGVINKREQGGVVSQDSEASGFVWDSRGYIVTNYHCIQPVLNDRAGSMVRHCFESFCRAFMYKPPSYLKPATSWCSILTSIKARNGWDIEFSLRQMQ